MRHFLEKNLQIFRTYNGFLAYIGSFSIKINFNLGIYCDDYFRAELEVGRDLSYPPCEPWQSIPRRPAHPRNRPARPCLLVLQNLDRPAQISTRAEPALQKISTRPTSNSVSESPGRVRGWPFAGPPGRCGHGPARTDRPGGP